MNDIKTQIEAANQKVMEILLDGQPVWTDVRPAGEAIPGFHANLLLHAGPPVKPADIVPPVMTTLCGAAVHEGLAKDFASARAMIESGEIQIAPAQDYDCACGAAMVTSASTPVLVGQDTVFGGQGFSAIHPGTNPICLRWGYYNDAVEKDLSWFRDVYGPVLGKAIRSTGGINLRNILSRTAGMGDENHVRQTASSFALVLEMIRTVLDLDDAEGDAVIRALIDCKEKFFLHVLMAGVMAILKSAKNVPMSTVMVGMGGNGTTFGLQFSGTGKQWFSVPAPKIIGQFLNPTWTDDEMCGYLGDSCVTEIYGLGGFSAIAGPGFVRLTGGTFADAHKRTEEARSVSLSEHKWAPIPWDDYRGFPVGIDLRRVVANSTQLIIHGGSTRLVGGQGGAGAMVLPQDLFKQALRAFSQQIGRN